MSTSQRVHELPPPPKALGESRRPPRIEAEESRPTGCRRWWSYIGRRLSSGCVVSFLFHLSLLLVLALAVQASRPRSTFRGLTAYTGANIPLQELAQDQLDFLSKPQRTEGDALEVEQQYRVPEIAPPTETQASPNRPKDEVPGTEPREPTDGPPTTDAAVGGALAGRGRKARAALAQSGGGTPDSERAVERGLRWLLAHQRDDGSWNFNHHRSNCPGRCRNPGTATSTTAATAIALLPFLGAGHTHTEGEYQDLVGRGLYYLKRRTLRTPHGNDLRQGTMYAQGLSTIALCEALAMTEDPGLRDYAQGAIDFVCYVQNRKGGGWRYTPGEPGDTTVTGWQLMGLKSGQMAKLTVPMPTIYMVRRFLGSVQSDYGSQYGYMSPRPRRTTTAIGLLCRMYTGWPHDHPGLKRGVMHLSEWGPSDDNIYYNYYATQVMHHWQGSAWERWNAKMRDYLIATQARQGHESGSWHFSGGRGDVGGRLYNTAMAVMTLEVYYRYMPLYRQDAVHDGF